MEQTRTRLLAAIARMHEPWAGMLCLDFANTLEPRGGPPPVQTPPNYQFRDELLSCDDLIGWAVHKDELVAEIGEALIAAGDAQPERAMAVVERGRELRDAVYRVFWAIAHRQRPTARDLETLAREYADGAAAAKLEPTERGIRWHWPVSEMNLAMPLWPVAWSAAELLTAGDVTRVKVCPGTPGQPVSCGWLFYDATRSRTRRWCSMTDCGSVVKARRQTARRRAAREQ